MTDPAQGRTRGRRRWYFVTAAVLVAAALGLSYRHLTNNERVRRIVESGLQRYAPGRVQVGSAEFSLFGGTVIRDVVVRTEEPNDGSSTPSLLTCPRMEVIHNPISAITGSPAIEALIAFEPTATIIHDADAATTNLGAVMTAIASPPAEMAGSLPLIELRDACVSVISRRNGNDHMVEQLRLSVRGRMSATDRGQYDIVWVAPPPERGLAPVRGHSQIDVRTGALRNVDGGLPQMNIEAVLLAVNARVEGAGVWAELLGLGGKVQARDYDLGGTGTKPDPRSATIDLTDATLSIPYDDVESSLPKDQRYIRFREVNGTAVVTARRITARFDGLFRGSPCHVEGTIDWSERPRSWRELGFNVRLVVGKLQLPRVDRPNHPDEARLIASWPVMERLYDEFDPVGHAEVELTLVREPGRDNPTSLTRLLLRPRGGSIMARAFPYRIDDLEGEIELTESVGTVRGLRGRHGTGNVTIEAEFDSPGRGDGANIRIRAEHLVLDDKLRAVIPPAHRRIWEQIGVTGFIDLDVSAVRVRSDDDTPPKWSVRQTITFDDLAARFAAFPYPLDHLRGSVTVDGHRAIFERITMDRGEAQLHARGAVETSAGHLDLIDISIDGTNMAIDDTLMAALPVSTRAVVSALEPRGRFDMQARLRRDSRDAQLERDIRITLRGNTIKSKDLPVRITDVLGELAIRGDTTVLHDVTGRHGNAVVRANGVVHHAQTGSPLDLTFECSRVTPDEELYNALPAAWRSRLADWSLDGEFDVTINTCSLAEMPDRRTTSASIRLNGATVTPPNFPVPIEDLRGTLVIDDRGARGSELTGRFQEAELHGSLDLTVDQGVPREATIQLQATSLSLDDRIKQLLSSQLQRVWQRASPDGLVDMTIDRLHYVAAHDDRSATVTTSGRAKLRDVSLAGWGRMDRAVGDLTFSGSLRDREGGMTLSGDIDLAGVRLYERKLMQATGTWSVLRTGDDTGRIALEDIDAKVYDGSLSGSIEVMLDPGQARYAMAADLLDVELAPLLAPNPRSTGGERALRGRADMQLELSGTRGDLHTRRGHGLVKVTDSNIYELPVVLAMLQVLNLSLPDRNTFSALEASGYLVADTITLGDTRITGDAMMLVGQGTVALPSLAAELIFVSVNPSRWGRVPVLNDILDGVSQRVVALAVSGTLRDPIVRIRPFHGISDELRRIFIKQKPKNRQSGGP